MTGQYFGRDGLFALLLNRVHSPLDHLKGMIAPDFIADLLGFGQLSPSLGLLLNVLSPGRIGNSLKMYAFFGYDCF